MIIGVYENYEGLLIQEFERITFTTWSVVSLSYPLYISRSVFYLIFQIQVKCVFAQYKRNHRHFGDF